MRGLVEVAFFTPDIDRMVEFYAKVLDRDLSGTTRGEDAWFVVDGIKWFIHKTYTGYELPAFNHLALADHDLDRSCAQLRAAGLKIDYGPKDWPWGRSAYLRDPDGNWIELNQVEKR